ncbi:MAG: hypothetical protein AMXMBFR84_14230 [Candidatus Hydrogenedentota bacterium]
MKYLQSRKVIGALILSAILFTLQHGPSNAAEAQADDPYAGTSKTKVGDLAPAFEVPAIDGKIIKSEEWKGKVGVIVFFATWCGPCRAELPAVEKELWLKHKDAPFELVVIGREHTNDELASFKTETGYTFPLAGDPERAVYGKYATKYIPRTYVIGADGKILFQSIGYEKPEFEEMQKVVETALAGLEQASLSPSQGLQPESPGTQRVSDSKAPAVSNGSGLKGIEVGGEIRVRASYYHKD